jgi:hypothetical protein
MPKGSSRAGRCRQAKDCFAYFVQFKTPAGAGVQIGLEAHANQIIAYPNGKPGAEVGPFGVNSTGSNTVIRNLTVSGKPANSWEANIYVRSGIVSGSTAERIKVDLQHHQNARAGRGRRRSSPNPTR